MGDRINFAFKDREGHAVVLYSHWGATGWQHDIAGALEHARPRWDDSAYGTRMMISYLISDKLMDETGYGIYAVTDTSCLDSSFDQVIFLELFHFCNFLQCLESLSLMYWLFLPL